MALNCKKKGKVKRCKTVKVTRCVCVKKGSKAKAKPAKRRATKRKTAKKSPKRLTALQKVKLVKRLLVTLTPPQHDKVVALFKSRSVHATDWDKKLSVIREVKRMSKFKPKSMGLSRKVHVRPDEDMVEATGWVG